jgi:RNA polymerase subunit RPABC4/transcription elongation factor Spt4
MEEPMIGEGPSLNESLPQRLKEALDRELQPGEGAIVAVRGRPREALVVTASRLLMLREGSGIADVVTVEAYPLAELTDLELRERGLEPQLALRLTGRSEPATFDVPAYDAGKFRMVIEAVRRMPRPDAEPGVAGASVGARGALRCPKCGAALPEQAAYCAACGLQTRDLCWDCGRPLETEWRFCPACGADTTEVGVIPCPSCREPVPRDHAYCARCGTAVRSTCDECDRILRRSWQHCPDCGSPTASEGSVGRSQGRAVAESLRRTERPEPSTPFPEVGDAQAAPGSGEAEALNQQGIAAYEAERFDEAIALFQRAVALDPNNATFHCNLAVAYGELRRDDEAFAEYQTTLELNPSNVRALVDLGYLYSEQERYEEARDCWERAIRAAPDSSEAAEARDNLQNLEQL